MNILLIEPDKAPATIGGEDIFLYEPLALEYIAAGVAADHDVRILDLRVDKALDDTLATFRPDVIGITGYTVHVNRVRALLEAVKRWNPRVLTVVGGHHATVAPDDFALPTADLVVRGEGVHAFREIVRRFERGQPFDGIAGLAGGPDPAAIDLDATPFPARELTARYRRYYRSEWMRPLASIRTSKGCPHRCTFCALWKLAGGRYFRRQPEKVIEELAGVAEPFVFFADDESLVDAARMKTLAALIREAGIEKRYFLYARSDTITRHPDLLAAWRAIGLERVFVGLEFFRDQDLRFIGKGSTVGDNEQAVRVLQDLGIEIYASFIVHPDFTRPDFAAFRRYCRGLKLNFASFAVLTPLPGTDFYDEVKGRLLTDNYDYFDFLHTLLPTALPLREFYAEYAGLMRHAVSTPDALKLMARYPARDIVPALNRNLRLLDRLRAAYQDY